MFPTDMFVEHLWVVYWSFSPYVKLFINIVSIMMMYEKYLYCYSGDGLGVPQTSTIQDSKLTQ